MRRRTVGDRSRRRQDFLQRGAQIPNLSETGFKGRFLGLKARKPLVYEHGFLVVG